MKLAKRSCSKLSSLGKKNSVPKSRMFPISMNAMSIDDLQEMISFRLRVAGHNGDLFEDSEEAYKVLYAYTKGLPRDAIKVCFELLIDLVALGKKQATAAQ